MKDDWRKQWSMIKTLINDNFMRKPIKIAKFKV